MPKMKTHKGAKKRFKITASGKVKRTKAMNSKYAIKKTGEKLQKLGKLAIAAKGDERRVKRLLSS